MCSRLTGCPAVALLLSLSSCGGRALPTPRDAPVIVPGQTHAAMQIVEVSGFEVLEVILGDPEDDEAVPLIVALHGRGGQAVWPQPVLLGLPVSVRVAVIRGPIASGGGFGWFDLHYGSASDEQMVEAIGTVTDRLAVAVNALIARRPTSGKAIVYGFSQGGALAFGLAVRHGNIVGAAFPCAAWFPSELVPVPMTAPAAPIHALHSRDDSVIPVGAARGAVEGLRVSRVSAELHEFDGAGHMMSAEMDAQLHEWLGDAVTRAYGDPPI